MTDEAITRPLGRMRFSFFSSLVPIIIATEFSFFNITFCFLRCQKKNPIGPFNVARSCPISPDIVRRWPNAGRSCPMLPEDRSLRYQQQRRRFGRAIFGSCICPDLRTTRRITNANVLRGTRPTRNTTPSRWKSNEGSSSLAASKHRNLRDSLNIARIMHRIPLFSYRSSMFSTVSKFPVLRRTRSINFLLLFEVMLENSGFSVNGFSYHY